MDSPRSIVFFGSGPVAAKSLELLSENFTIEAVITKPKPAHHRGDFPVLVSAEKRNIPVHTVSTRVELSELIATNPFKSKLGVLIDFGIIVAQDVIDYFPSGILNSHFSILPEWRGADPITFAILSGQESTGVTLMFLVEAMDEGPIYTYGELTLDGTETTPVLTERLIELSDKLLKKSLPQILPGSFSVSDQDVTKRATSYSRKLTKNDGIIDWRKSAEVIEREVRAFIDWPKSTTRLADKDVILTHVRVVKGHGAPGTTKIVNRELLIYCGTDALVVERLKPAGKQEMTGTSFIAGHHHLL